MDLAATSGLGTDSDGTDRSATVAKREVFLRMMREVAGKGLQQTG